MRSIYTEPDFRPLYERISVMKDDHVRQWGKMDPAHMLAHCSTALEVALGKRTLKRLFLGRILGPLIKKNFLSEKPFSRNSPTAKEFIVTNARDFDAEKQRLLSLLKECHQKGEAGATKHPHGFFGHLTPRQWGETQWKHLDHHLRQFGA